MIKTNLNNQSAIAERQKQEVLSLRDMFSLLSFRNALVNVEAIYGLRLLRRRTTSFVMTIYLTLLAGLLLASPDSAFANNLNIKNAYIVSQNTTSDTLTIQFDISWENSWRDSENYDAVWVFIKYQTNPFIEGAATYHWQHATLKTSGTNPSGFSQGSGTGLDIFVPSDKRGFFLQRSSSGTAGSVSTTSIQVLWDYAANGLSDTQVNNLATPIRLFGIEMVYVPQNGFYMGDGSDGANGEIESGGVNGSKPCAVSSEGSLFFTTLATVDGCYYNTDLSGDDIASGQVFTIAESFPKGFKAFYAMKYEVTQGQYAAFLNTLSREGQKNRVASDIYPAEIANYYVMSAESQLSRSNRNTITVGSTGNGSHHPVNFTAGRPYRAMNYMSWMDLAAFADWAALRPMSELEYEKLARGPLYPVDGEYAWGSTVITFYNINIASPEDGTEKTDGGKQPTPSANYGSNTFTSPDGGTGPWRVGIVNATQTSNSITRQNAGSGYYGASDLTGNVWERAVTIGNSAGRNFAGTHGDGEVELGLLTSTITGNATNIDWPGIDATAGYGVSGAAGSGLRGGSWSTSSLKSLEISNRARAAEIDATRGSDYGGRLVRTAA